MFCVDLECKKCGSITEIIGKPNEKINSFLCPECKCGKLFIKRAQSVDGKGMMAAIADLNERLKTIEDVMIENGMKIVVETQ